MITVGLVSSICAYASRNASRSCPPRLLIAAASPLSSSSAMRPAISSAPGPSPGSRVRNSPALQRSNRWYSGFGMSRMRRRSCGPPARSNRASNRLPNLTSITCQPAAENIDANRPAAMLGTTRSNDCRFMSTIQTISPSSATDGSRIASHTAPSSSSASPTSEYWRPVPVAPNAASTYRRAIAPQIGAVAPIPTDPVE